MAAAIRASHRANPNSSMSRSRALVRPTSCASFPAAATRWGSMRRCGTRSSWAGSARTHRDRPGARPRLFQLVAQRERMLEPVADGGAAVPAQALQLAGAGTRHDGVALFRLPALEHTGALEHEAARPPIEASDDALETHERRRAVAPVHHQVLDVALALETAGERLRDARARQLGSVLPLTVGLLVPCLDGELGGDGLHDGVSLMGWARGVPGRIDAGRPALTRCARRQRLESRLGAQRLEIGIGGHLAAAT